MSEVTVKQLASTVGIPVERLLTQLSEAGISASGADSTLTEQEKVQLLSYLRRSHGRGGAEGGADPSQVTLKRKSVSELRQPAVTPRVPGTNAGGGGGGGGSSRPTPAARAKTISVEVRRKRTYVKRGDEPAAPAEAETPAEAPVEAPSQTPAQTPVQAAAPTPAARPAAPPPRRTAAPPPRPSRERQTLRSNPMDDGRRRLELASMRAEQEARRLGELEDHERKTREAAERQREADEA